MRFISTVLLIGWARAHNHGHNDHGDHGYDDHMEAVNDYEQTLHHYEQAANDHSNDGECVEEYCGCDQFRQWEQEIEIWRHYQDSKFLKIQTHRLWAIESENRWL